MSRHAFRELTDRWIQSTNSHMISACVAMHVARGRILPLMHGGTHDRKGHRLHRTLRRHSDEQQLISTQAWRQAVAVVIGCCVSRAVPVRAATRSKPRRRFDSADRAQGDMRPQRSTRNRRCRARCPQRCARPASRASTATCDLIGQSRGDGANWQTTEFRKASGNGNGNGKGNGHARAAPFAPITERPRRALSRPAATEPRRAGDRHHRTRAARCRPAT